MSELETTMALNPRLKLVSGVGNGADTACLMSARSLLDGRPFSDSHPSRWLRAFGITINDRGWWCSDQERTEVLLPLAMDERLCASKCDVSKEAEEKRREILVNWSTTVAAPHAIQSAARAMDAIGRSDWGDALRDLVVNDIASLQEARSWLSFGREDALAAKAYAAADAAAYAAADAAADAADAADAAYAAYAYAADAYAYAAADAAYAAADAAYADRKKASWAARIEIRTTAIECFKQMLSVGRAEKAA